MERRGRHEVGRREQVLDVLRGSQGAVSIAAVAERLAIHANTVRFHLDTLVANGQVERTTAGSGAPGRPAQMFRPVRGMDPMGPRRYRGLAEALVATLAAEPDPGRRGVEVGRAWGRVQAESRSAAGSDPVDQLVGMLEEMGFAPDAPKAPDRDGDSQIALRHCPFLELAVDRAEVVCPIHLGLMQGAMDVWDAQVTVDRLDPFVEPDRCVAHLGRGQPIES